MALDSPVLPPSTRRGPRSPRRARSPRRRGRARAAAAAGMRTSAMRRRKWRVLRPGGEARGALGRQRVVRARDVVAERGAAVVADEQAAGAAHARRERLGRGAHQLQVLGRERLGEGQRGLEVLGLRRRPAVGRQQRPGRRSPPRRASPARAPPARAGPRPPTPGPRPPTGSRRGRSARRSRRCRRPRSAAAWPPARRGCPGPTITSTRGTLSVPRASAAIACAPPIA